MSRDRRSSDSTDDIFYDAPGTSSGSSDGTDYKDENMMLTSTDDASSSGSSGEPKAFTSEGGTDSQSRTSTKEGSTTNLRKRIQKYRKRLPHNMRSTKEFSVWSVLKQAVGKDLSRFTFPVIFNEPLSFIQRLSEYMEYVNLLHEATRTDDPVKRLMLVTTYMISCYTCNEIRLDKPFNPLLGETFELVREDLDIRLIAEQVSHHPPISALYAESNSGFSLEMTMQPQLKFWGIEVEVKPKGYVIIKIPKYNDVYTFSYINSAIHNIIIGTLWIELRGQSKIKNRSTGHKAYIHFKPVGWFGNSKDVNQVEGHIIDEDGVAITCIKADWTRFVCSCPADQEDLLDDIVRSSTGDCERIPEGVTLNWKATPKPEYAHTMYNMTEFAMGLNELLDEHKGVIAPTDCRYRPDMRCVENGDIDGAAAEKLRLEEKQRATRKIMAAKKETWKPLWFAYENRDELGAKAWTYKGDYFKREYSKCPDIY